MAKSDISASSDMGAKKGSRSHSPPELARASTPVNADAADVEERVDGACAISRLAPRPSTPSPTGQSQRNAAGL